MCFIGEDQPAKFGKLAAELSWPASATGDGKRVPSGFAYWGIIPAVAWRNTCQDDYYTLMRESIRHFPNSWAALVAELDPAGYHYASLGTGTGEKDGVIVRALAGANPRSFFFPIDMSPEMLRLGSRRAVDGSSISRGNVLPIQIDFSRRENIDEISRLLQSVVGDEAILYSFLGNTLSNFENDEEILAHVAALIRPQDRLLLEVAMTNVLTDEAAQAATQEYNQSRSFKEFVSSSLIQNTDLPVLVENVEFRAEVEPGRSILIKTVYRNRSRDVAMRIGTQGAVPFPSGDTIRLSTIRKYSEHGLRSLLTGAGLRVMSRSDRSHAGAIRGKPDFGSATMLLRTGERAALGDARWDFFLAHASCDKPTAERLYTALTEKGARVFLDSKSIRLGDSWDKAIPDAQASSRVTLVLVSESTEDAYYERDEIAAAIALARQDGGTHRVVPIYYQANAGRDIARLPYGLRLKQAATLTQQNLEDVVRRLLECL